MKIILNDAAYVQKKDLDFLVYKYDKMPNSVRLKIYSPGQSWIDSSNKYDFIKFEDETAIDFFKEMSWILDYSDIRDLSEEEILELRKKIAEERDEVQHKYSSMTEQEKKQNSNLYDEYELLNYKSHSLTPYLWFKQGDIEMVFPDELEKGTYQKKLGTMPTDKLS